LTASQSGECNLDHFLIAGQSFAGGFSGEPKSRDACLAGTLRCAIESHALGCRTFARRGDGALEPPPV
jgi:hypothetical protein